jgi:predicted lactoylglutathione lyase
VPLGEGFPLSRNTFVNLPVHDLGRSVAFFTALGFAPGQPADDRTAQLVISEQTYLMLHADKFFAEFAGAPAPDPATHREVVVGLSTDARAEVDDLVERAVAAGGQAVGEPQDWGFMYMRAFRDLDGHQWSFMHMS